MYIKVREILSFAILFSPSPDLLISPTIGLLGIYLYYTLAAFIFDVMLFRQLKNLEGRDGNPNGLGNPLALIGNLLICRSTSFMMHRIYEWRKTHMHRIG